MNERRNQIGKVESFQKFHALRKLNSSQTPHDAGGLMGSSGAADMAGPQTGRLSNKNQ